MERQLLCVECGSSIKAEHSLDAAGIAYPYKGETLKLVSGKLKPRPAGDVITMFIGQEKVVMPRGEDEYDCDFCAVKLWVGSIVYACSWWKDGSPYIPWEGDYLE